MPENRLHFDEVFKMDGYGLVVYFSDGTNARFTVDELANLRPNRELSQKLDSSIGPLNE